MDFLRWNRNAVEGCACVFFLLGYLGCLGQCTSGLPRSEDILDTDLSASVFVPSPQQAGGGLGMALLGPWKKMKALLDAWVLLGIGNLIFST